MKQLPMFAAVNPSVGLFLAAQLAALSLRPGVVAGQFIPGGREILSLSIASAAGGQLPQGLRLLRGSVSVVEKDGLRMLKASSESEFLVTLPEVLPQDFTIEFEIIPKGCCNPADLTFEGTPTMNRGSASAHIEWDPDGLVVMGGGPQYTGSMPEDLKSAVAGTLTQVSVSFEGGTIKMYTNGRRLYTLTERRFVRGRVLRVSLGGQDDGEQAVHLARLRVAAGGPGSGTVAANRPVPPGAVAGPVARATPAPASAPTPTPTAVVPASPGAIATEPALVTLTGVTVTLGAAGPIVNWTALRSPATYTVERRLFSDASCCNHSSGRQALRGPPWQDQPLPQSGSYVYRVIALLDNGTTAQGETQFGYRKPEGPVIATTPAPTTVVTTMTPTTATATPMAPPPPPPPTVSTEDSRRVSTGGVAPTAVPPAPPPAPDPGGVLVGTGISDITGPIAEVGMMGYGKFDQQTAGLHTRLYARAFIFAKTGGKRVVFVSAELGQLFSSIKQGVLSKLAAPPYNLGNLYNDHNVMISATHTHSGPGGYSHHAQYNLTSWGHVRQNYAAIVDGISEAIARADSSLAPATVSLAAGKMLAPASVNRGMKAYTLNPDARSIASAAPAPVAGPVSMVPAPPAPPAWPDSVDSDMTVLGIQRSGRRVGAIAWFAVHNTSITQNNRLVSSDHKGYAAYLMEKKYGSIAPLRNFGGFVAAFPNGAEGDLSPNLNVSNPKEFKGPGTDEYDSMRLIGEVEYTNAEHLHTNQTQTPILGDIDFRHAFVMMPGRPVLSSNHTNGAGLKFLCPAAYGASFMAGAKDGPTGMMEEGMALGSTMSFAALTDLRRIVSGVVTAIIPPLGIELTKMMLASSDLCQVPKPVLIPSGSLGWTPDILPFQLLRVGPVAIAGIPGEMTMQAGRRLQARILALLLPLGVQRVILTGLANEYSGYITTPEEYDAQLYEGASTLFGRLTFDAYLEVFGALSVGMASGQPVPPTVAGPPPLPLGARQIELQFGVARDELQIGETFGKIGETFSTVLAEPLAEVTRGGSVYATFRSGHPKNNLRRNNSYFRIERYTGNADNWELVAWDSTPDTRLYWSRPSPCSDPCYLSSLSVSWKVPDDAAPGTYRIRLTGSWKNGVTQTIQPYEGRTRSFEVR